MASFDEIFISEGLRVIRTPVRAPVANSYAERWIGTVRRECLDRLLILGRGHLQRTLHEYVEHYNQHRPHRSLDQHPPAPPQAVASPSVPDPARVQRHPKLGGLINEYRTAA